MTKKLLLLIVLIFITTNCTNNNKKGSDLLISKKDSLSIYFDLANIDTIAYQKRHVYNEKAIAIISGQKNDSLNRVYYFKAANRYFNMNAMDDYKKITEEIIKKSNEDNDSLSLAKAYSYLGDYYNGKFISDSAYQFYFKAEKSYRRLKDNSKIAKILLNKSVLQFNEKDFIGSEKSAFDALKFLRKTNNQGLTYDAYNLLGVIYNELSEYDKAISYHNRALSLIKNKTDESYSYSRYSSLNNIGLVFQNSKNHKRAVAYFKAALKESNLFEKTPLSYTYIINNLGYSEFKLGDYKNIPSLFYRTLKISDSLNIIPTQIASRLHLSEYYAIKKDTAVALKFSNEAYVLAKKSDLSRERLLSLKQLLNVDTKNVVRYSTEYIRINDSLQLAERKVRNKLARIEFETEELSLEKEKLIEQRKKMIYAGLGILLLGVFIYVIRSQAAKNRELLLVQEQQKANEEIYQLMLNQQNKVEEVRQAEKKKIAQELHDGILGKLFGTRMNLGVLNTKDGEQAVNDRTVYIDELKKLEQEIREISHDLNTEKTAVFNNFVIMVSNFIETQRTVCQAAISFSTDPKIEWNLVNNTAKINLYRILQEAFQNINKYSEAKNVTVTFTQIENLIQLQIVDDGIGFDSNRKKKGIGLQNMHSRITASNGTMVIESKVGAGMSLQFNLPLS